MAGVDMVELAQPGAMPAPAERMTAKMTPHDRERSGAAKMLNATNTPTASIGRFPSGCYDDVPAGSWSWQWGHLNWRVETNSGAF
ncbi:hypothetical protein OAG63_00760 [Methylacidiphilales bacterium]|nr:hypothetical protein [Candidatus Methylacidiphilales bacterium]